MKDETYQDSEVCEACGCAGEMGYIIKEGDDVATVTISAESPKQRQLELEQYLALAKQVNANVQYQSQADDEQPNTLHAQFQFEVSAEKLIFELKSRSLAR